MDEKKALEHEFTLDLSPISSARAVDLVKKTVTPKEYVIWSVTETMWLASEHQRTFTLDVMSAFCFSHDEAIVKCAIFSTPGTCELFPVLLHDVLLIESVSNRMRKAS